MNSYNKNSQKLKSLYNSATRAQAFLKIAIQTNDINKAQFFQESKNAVNAYLKELKGK
jgi:hypothetical protein